jgi:hypothetical protein
MVKCKTADCDTEVTKKGFYLCYPCWKKLNPKKGSSPKKQIKPVDPSTLITSTKICEHILEQHSLKISSQKLNSILNELGWISKPPYDVGGWQTTRNGKRNGGVNQEALRGGSPYVKWGNKILKNKGLLRAVRDMLGSDVKEVAVSEVTVSEKDESNPQAHNAPNRAKTIKTRDGHYVASRGECIVDNFLYGARIAHAYEQELYLGEDAKVMIPDFTALTPKCNVYIEFWGMEGKPAYDKRKEIKKKLYAEYDLELVEVYPKHLDYIDAYLGKIFAKYGVKTAF